MCVSGDRHLHLLVNHSSNRDAAVYDISFSKIRQMELPAPRPTQFHSQPSHSGARDSMHTRAHKHSHTRLIMQQWVAFVVVGQPTKPLTTGALRHYRRCSRAANHWGKWEICNDILHLYIIHNILS